MDALAELGRHEADQLARLRGMSSEEKETLYVAIAELATHRLHTIREYCHSLSPSENSSLSIVYEALSEYSTKCDDFLCEEVQRLTGLAREGDFDCKYLDVLSKIDATEMYDNNRRTYVAIVDCLVGHLDPPASRQFTVAVLELLEWFFLDYSKDDKFPEFDAWTRRLKHFTKASDPDVRDAAEDALCSLKGSSMSLFQKIGCLVSLTVAVWSIWKLVSLLRAT